MIFLADFHITGDTSLDSSGFTTGLSGISAAASAMAAHLTAGFSSAAASAAVSAAAMVSGFSGGAGQLTGIAAGLVSQLCGIFSASGTWASVGHNIISGIANGVRAAAGALASAAAAAAQSALSAAKNALGIHSPSRAFRDEVGRWIPAGIAVGIRADTAEALGAVDELALRMQQRAASAAGAGQLQASTLSAVGTAAAQTAAANTQPAPAAVSFYNEYHINEALSEAELTRQAQDLAERMKNKLP